MHTHFNMNLFYLTNRCLDDGRLARRPSLNFHEPFRLQNHHCSVKNCLIAANFLQRVSHDLRIN